tara:strand:+ start:741 stop:3062 length:2322 start_codon:yes stop_codon:yes gene_type:complete
MQPTQKSDKPTGGFRDSIVNLIIAQPLLILCLFLVLAGGLGWQAQNFEIDASPDTLLTRDNELYQQTQQVNERYAPQEFLLLTYEPLNQQLYSDQTFDDILTIADDIMELPRVESVRHILNVPVFSGVEGVTELDADLSGLSIDPENYDSEALRDSFDNHPIYTNLLVNEDQTATAMQILFRDVEGEYSQQELEQMRVDEVDRIRELTAPYAERASIHLGGVHVIAYQLINIISSDLIVFGLAIAALICVLLLILFRGLRWVAIPVICCACSVLPTMGLFALLGIKATVISANFIALQLILTLAIVIHLIVQYREEVTDDSGDHKNRIRRTLQHKIGPCLFAGVTTSVGFASLIFSDIQPVISFGWMMIIAMGFSILASLVLFPVLVLLLPRGEIHDDYRGLTGLVGGMRKLALGKPVLVCIAAALILAVGIAGATLLSVENSFINYFRTSTLIHQELAYIDQDFGGTTPLDITYQIQETPDNPDLIMSAEASLTLQRIHQVMENFEATGRILSPVNLTDLAREVNNDRPITEYELTAIYWLMEEEFREDLVGSFFNEELQEVRFNVWIQDLTPGLNRAEFLDQVRTDLAAIGVTEESYQLTNLFMLYQQIMQKLFDSQIKTLGLVYIAITLMFMLIFRSVKIALVAIVPNIISTAAIFGVMGWAGLPLDLMTITIAAIVMGIAVDDTIHYIHRYLEERKSNDVEVAIDNTHRSVGMAVLYTSVLIAAGFSMLAFSDFVPSVIFGLLTALAMIMALLADLCLLPVLLKRFVSS